MATKYVGGIISKTAPTVTPPVGGEGGSASGVWTMEQALPYIRAGTWPLPVAPKGLWGTGRNSTFGQLGLGNLINYSSPKQVGALTDWKYVSAGSPYFSMAVKQDGSLWGWGRNGYGQLGLGNTVVAYSSPKQVGLLTDWATVSIGESHCAAIKTNGTLWTWGAPFGGCLGQGNSTVYYSSPKQVGALSTWSKISASGYFNMAIKTDGTLWGWGTNSAGQLGLGNLINYSSPKQVGALTTWTYISNSNNFCLATRTDGTLWAWGYNVFGQLGQGTTTYYSSPKQVGGLTTWSTVNAASNFSTAIKTDGTLWSWGINNAGQLGLGNTSTYTSPKQVGILNNWKTLNVSGNSYSTSAIKTDGTLWAWGSGSYGQLGLGNTTNYSSPKQVGSLTTWKQVATSESFLLALKS
jgi:alpha-tubulin suppressor-like RCC1 family protein